MTSFFLHVALNDICCDVARDSHWIFPPKQRLPYLFMVIGADDSGAPSHSPKLNERIVTPLAGQQFRTANSSGRFVDKAGSEHLTRSATGTVVRTFGQA
ncbi:hypothetical protein QTN80_13580 [Arachnia propionica]|uniref:hypothetical protein n=1 Tax=Arachnia propionica TaxID=1750 RepID=UPI00398FC58C